jgi:hypothetical protein
MWVTLSRGAQHRLALRDRQSIWPTPDGRDAELMLLTRVELLQEVLLVTPRVLRLRYVVVAATAAMAIDDQPEVPIGGAERLVGKGFELMVTERGPMVVPATKEKLSGQLASFMGTITEDVRCAWPLPPDDAAVGSEWRLLPAVPGGLPSRASRADLDVTFSLTALTAAQADVAVRFAVRVVIEEKNATLTGEGTGTMAIQLDRTGGLIQATRDGELTLGSGRRPAQRIRSRMELARL